MLNEPSDFEWLSGTHCPDLPDGIRFALLHGDMDAPERIEGWFAPEPEHNAPPDFTNDMVEFAFTPEQVSTIVAALRLYQQHEPGSLTLHKSGIDAIATNCSRQNRLTLAGIDTLVDKLNGADL